MAKGNRNNFKVVKNDAKSVNPQMTIEVKNPELVEAIKVYVDEKTPANLNVILDLLQSARVLVPAATRELNGKVIPVPAIFANKEGSRYIWVYTDREQMPKEQPKVAGCMNMAFADLVKLAVIPEENLKGIYINPQSGGIVLTQIALKALKEGKKAPEVPQKPADPQMTIELKNDELEAALSTYKFENTPANLVALVECASKARILTPIVMKEIDGQVRPVPVLMSDKEGRKLIALYTSKQYIPKELKTGIINLPLMEVVKAAAKEAEADEKFYGLVFDPADFGIRFAPKLIAAMNADPEHPVEALNSVITPKPQQVKMTEQQYMAFEHMQFENAFLPAELFTGGQEFIDRLCSEKEEYVDQLFEESYKEKRMYPYLPEDFNVMALGVTENLELVQVGFPAQDQGVGSCERAYLLWDKATQKAKYFGVVRQNGGVSTIVEITEEGKRVDYGPCPTEGTEINKIIELAGM